MSKVFAKFFSFSNVSRTYPPSKLHNKYFLKFYKLMEKTVVNKICPECKGKLDDQGQPLEETVIILIFIFSTNNTIRQMSLLMP
jgi:hypothetical protein